MPEYLGDSVYVDFDGYHVILFLDNGMGPHTQIYLEPQVLANLDRYRKQLAKQLAQPPQPPVNESQAEAGLDDEIRAWRDHEGG